MRPTKKTQPPAPSPAARPAPEPDALVGVHTRFFKSDVAEIQRIAAEKGLPWQIELRLVVRRALKGERREVLVLSEKKP
jgi:hypothetical protein